MIQNQQNEKNLEEINDLRRELNKFYNEKDSIRYEYNQLKENYNKIIRDLEYARQR